MRVLLKKYLSRLESLVQKDTKYLIIGLAFLSIFAVLLLLFFLILLEFIFKVQVFENNLFEKLWYTFVFFIDPGRIAEEDYSENSQVSIAFKLIATGIGIIAFSTLIATISQVVHDTIEKLRSGLKNVTAVNHIIIIGFTEKTMPLLHEFFEGIEDKKETFVIYTEKDPQFVQKQINEYSDFDEKKHDIVIKLGNSSAPKLVEKLNILAAKKIIILNKSENESDSLNSDIEAIEFFTKIVQSNEWLQNPSKIVVEINNPIVANTAKNYCKDFLNLHSSYDPIFVFKEKFRNLFFSLSLNNAYILEVIQSLFGFVDKEFYFLSEKNLNKFSNKGKIANKTFGGIMYEFPELLIVGVYWGQIWDNQHNKDVILSPDYNFFIKEGMGLIVIDESMSVIKKKLGNSNISKYEINSNVKINELKKCQVSNISVLDSQGFREDTLDLIKTILQYNESTVIQKINYLSLGKNTNYIESGNEKKNIRRYNIKPTHLDYEKYNNVKKSKDDPDALKLGIKTLPIVKIVANKNLQKNNEYYFQIINFIDENIEKLFLEKGINKGDFLLAFFPGSSSIGYDFIKSWKDFLITDLPSNGDKPLSVSFETKSFILEGIIKDKSIKELKVVFSKSFGKQLDIASFNRKEIDYLSNICKDFNYINIRNLDFEYKVDNSVVDYTLTEKSEEEAFVNSHSYKFFVNNRINKSNKIVWLGGKYGIENLEQKDYLTQLFLQQVSNSPNTFSENVNEDESDEYNEFSAIFESELEANEQIEAADAKNKITNRFNVFKDNDKSQRNLDVLISTESMKSLKTLKAFRDNTYSKYNIGLIEQNIMMAKIIASYSSEPMIAKILNTFQKGSANIEIKYYDFKQDITFGELKFYIYKTYGFIAIGFINFEIDNVSINKKANKFLDFKISPLNGTLISSKKNIGVILLKKSNYDYNYRKFDEKTAFRYNFL